MIYEEINRAKFNFDNVYNSATPYRYFRAMRDHDYRIPESSSLTTKELLSKFIYDTGGKEISILDLGCSYGVNASVLKYGMGLSDLFGRYRDEIDRETLVRRDRELYASGGVWPELNFVGFDSADEAVRYAIDCGVIGDGFSANFECLHDEGNMSDLHASRTHSIDLVLSTGCVGYVTDRTFQSILSLAQPSLPKIIIIYVLRIFDYASIAECLLCNGYRTARLADQQFIQRRCANDEEHSLLLSQIRARGLDPVEAEIGGQLCADLYVSWRKEMPSPVLHWGDSIQPVIMGG